MSTSTTAAAPAPTPPVTVTAATVSDAVPDVMSDVVSSATLRNAGMARSTIIRRCRPGGPWRRLLPGVVLLGDHEPTRDQLLHAARCQLGARAVITGLDALHAHGIGTHRSAMVRMLVPAERRTPANELIAPERTSRLPEPSWFRGLPFAPAARATVDAARHEPNRKQIRVLLRAALYFGACSVQGLWHEVDSGNQRGTAILREELRQLGDAAHVTDFGAALRVLRTGSVPQPRWHVGLTDPHGRALGVVDAWWDHLAVGWQFHDTHQPPCHANHNDPSRTGIIMVRSTSTRLHVDPAGVRKDIATAMRHAARRPRPVVTWHSAAAPDGNA